jgi:two-component system, OmpR family, alkaline phosphatase synthesis response regulator PhoP
VKEKAGQKPGFFYKGGGAVMAKRILIVDDEVHILELIRFNLEKEYQVRTAETGEEALEILNKEPMDLMILDLMLPGMDGIQVCNKVRNQKNLMQLPIIMLTAKNEDADRILGLEVGADDYLAKPFNVRELQARIKAVLRRSSYDKPEGKSNYQIRDLHLDMESREVRKKGVILPLTAKEFDLLKLLMEHQGKVLSRNFLLDKIWGYEYFGESRTVDVHIRHLRMKIDENEEHPYILTKRGIGYKMLREEGQEE